MLNVLMLNVLLLNVLMLNVIMLSVIMLNIVETLARTVTHSTAILLNTANKFYSTSLYLNFVKNIFFDHFKSFHFLMFFAGRVEGAQFKNIIWVST
jgi:hypothetical protein